MLQFYFLSVLLNICAGLSLILTDETNIDSGVNKKNFKLVLGILTLFVGFIKFIAVMPSDVPVVGDLIPAIAGLLGGFAILLDFYISQASDEVKINSFLENFFIKGKRYIGILCIIVGILHFLFPKVVIL